MPGCFKSFLWRNNEDSLPSRMGRHRGFCRIVGCCPKKIRGNMKKMLTFPAFSVIMSGHDRSGLFICVAAAFLAVEHMILAY